MTTRLAAEVRQTRGFKSLEEEAYLALARTADLLVGDIAELLRPHGLSPTQYNALRILRGAGDEGRTCAEVAERMLTRDPDVTRLVDRLASLGFAARFRDDRDRRVVRNRITRAGLELLSRLDAPKDARNREVLGVLGEERLAILIGLLAELRGRVGALGAPGPGAAR